MTSLNAYATRATASLPSIVAGVSGAMIRQRLITSARTNRQSSVSLTGLPQSTEQNRAAQKKRRRGRFRDTAQEQCASFRQRAKCISPAIKTAAHPLESARAAAGSLRPVPCDIGLLGEAHNTNKPPRIRGIVGRES